MIVLEKVVVGGLRRVLVVQEPVGEGVVDDICGSCCVCSVSHKT